MTPAHARTAFSLLAAVIGAALLSSCATGASAKGAASGFRKNKVMRDVRTTAYTHSERGHVRYGRMSASGSRLSAGPVRSAASDWSRFPVGTKFRIKETGQVYRIDDYGSALAGTSTIDLYVPTRREMNRWGVRHVDIEIIQWGSPQMSLRILEPRQRHRHVRVMVEGLREQTM